MPVALLISPLADGAYFDAVEAVARAELLLHFPDCAPVFRQWGPLRFFEAEVPRAGLALAARLSFVQGIFELAGASDNSLPLLALTDATPAWELPRELVYGAKYRGKTNELLTQLALNVAPQTCRCPPDRATKVLDPMAGRGTTLLQAARMGLDAVGIEQDPKAPDDMQRNVRKVCKLQRLRHKETKGTVGRRNAHGHGNFVQYELGERRVRLMVGDAREADQLLQQERFPMVVRDLPYGVQHTGPRGRRDPSAVLKACAPVWAGRLLPGGALVLCFNALLPKRDVLVQIFEQAGLVPHPFSAPHRMSASILRELAVFTKPLPAETAP